VLFDCTTKSLSGTALGEFVAAQHLLRRKEKGKKEVKGKSVKNTIAEIEKKERTRKYKNKYHKKGNKDGGHKHERRRNGHGIPRRNH